MKKLSKKIVALGLIGIVTGCATPMKREEYTVGDITIICDTYNGVNAEFKKISDRDIQVDAFCQPLNKKIYVRWSGDVDIRGEHKPDFRALGHELWHFVKGQYHE